MQEIFENSRTDFSSEVELLAKIDHRSLVKLLGYVDHGNERIIITEYVGNGTLREHLDGNVLPDGRLEIKLLFNSDDSVDAHDCSSFVLVGVHGKVLDFNQRLEIAIDIAHGLTYLHLYAG